MDRVLIPYTGVDTLGTDKSEMETTRVEETVSGEGIRIGVNGSGKGAGGNG